MMPKTLCYCHLVTDRDIEQAVLQGVVRFDELQSRTGACTSCGTCRFEVHYKFEKLKQKVLGAKAPISDPFDGMASGLDFIP